MGRASCRRGYPKADWAVFLAARPAHIRDFEARWRRRWAAIVVGKCGASRQPVRAGGGRWGPGVGGGCRWGWRGRGRGCPRPCPELLSTPAGASPWPPSSRTAAAAPRCPARWRRCPTTCLRRSCRRKVGRAGPCTRILPSGTGPDPAASLSPQPASGSSCRPSAMRRRENSASWTRRKRTCPPSTSGRSSATTAT